MVWVVRCHDLHTTRVPGCVGNHRFGHGGGLRSLRDTARGRSKHALSPAKAIGKGWWLQQRYKLPRCASPVSLSAELFESFDSLDQGCSANCLQISDKRTQIDVEAVLAARTALHCTVKASLRSKLHYTFQRYI